MKKIIGLIVLLSVIYFALIPMFTQWKVEKELREVLNIYSDELSFMGTTMIFKCKNLPYSKLEQEEIVLNYLKPYNKASKEFVNKGKELLQFEINNKQELEDEVESKLRKHKWLTDDFEKALDEMMVYMNPSFENMGKQFKQVKDDNKYLFKITFDKTFFDKYPKDNQLLKKYWNNTIKDFFLPRVPFEDRCIDYIMSEFSVEY